MKSKPKVTMMEIPAITNIQIRESSNLQKKMKKLKFSHRFTTRRPSMHFLIFMLLYR